MAYRVSSRAAFLLLLLGVFSLFQVSLGEEQYVQAVNEAGDTVYLKDSRKPALYTGNFGDCLGSSNVNVTRFDAAYYKDNMTVLFHLQGNTAIKNESIMSMEPLLGLGEQLANGKQCTSASTHTENLDSISLSTPATPTSEICVP
jgi:hypothetical protein